MSNNPDVDASPRADSRTDIHGQQLHSLNGNMVHMPPQYGQPSQIPMMVTHYPNASNTTNNMQQIRYQQPMPNQSPYYQQPLPPQNHLQHAPPSSSVPQQQQQQHQLQQHTTPQQSTPHQAPQSMHPHPQQQQQQQQQQPGLHQSSHQLQMVTNAQLPLPQQPQAPNMSTGPMQHHFQTPTRLDVPSMMGNMASAGSSSQHHGTKHPTPLGTPESQRKRQRKADHAFPGEDGDLELRNMASKILDVPLEEFAAKVRAMESSASSPTVSTPTMNTGRTMVVKSDTTKERQRQVFGMTWLMRACQASNSAVVPRNRIYARYVGICAEHGLKPLSPASFGKLVRIVFPLLTTRRLGMRGQSKYHYCGLKLVNDDGGTSSITSSANTPLHNQTFDSSFLPGTPFGSNSPASFHSQVSTPVMSNPPTASTNNSSISNFLNETPDLKFVPDLSSLLNDKSSGSDQQIELPDIKPYLPQGADIDAADTLVGLYKSHCASIFDSIRYVQLKRLFVVMSSFHGSLTAPVLRLYTSSEILPWVISSDAIMFKSLIKMLAKLALQDIPNSVLTQLKALVEKFVERLSESLSNLPQKITYAKLALSKQFCQLVSRFVRVVETAQSANKILSHHMDRELMFNDWTKHVNVEQIASRELPCDGDNFKKAVEILSIKLPELLKKESSDHESFIVEWGTYIASLPSTFTNVPPRLFLLCTSALLTTALREISLAGGGGFGAWWVVRCWVDEWIGWCAELGGFISTSFEDSSMLLQGPGDSHRVFVKKEKNNLAHEMSGSVNNNNHEELATETIDLLDGQFGGALGSSEESSQNKK